MGKRIEAISPIIKELVNTGLMDKYIAKKLGITPSHFSRLKSGLSPVTPRMNIKIQELLYGQSFTITDGGSMTETSITNPPESEEHLNDV
jgi:hypothetical protein